MGSRSTLVYHSSHPAALPAVVQSFATERGLSVVTMGAAEVLEAANRSYPAAIVLGGDEDGDSLALCRTLKSDPFSGVIPVVLLAAHGSDAIVHEALEAGVDEVLTSDMD